MKDKKINKTFSLDSDILKKIDELSERTHLKKSIIVQIALDEYFEKIKFKKGDKKNESIK